MKYYLHYQFGSCNDGSCEVGFEEFNTFAEANERLRELNDFHGNSGIINIVHGTCVLSQGY